jgi:hypothetical protein
MMFIACTLLAARHHVMAAPSRTLVTMSATPEMACDSCLMKLLQQGLCRNLQWMQPLAGGQFSDQWPVM